MSREQIWELEENKRSLLRQAYRMKQECPHMSPVGLEYEMYAAIMKEVREITARLQLSAEAQDGVTKENQYKNKKSFHPGLQMKAFLI